MIERGVVEPRVVVVRAVERVIVRAVAISINIELSKTLLGSGYSRAFHNDTRHQRHEFPEVAPVERQLVHESLLHHAAEYVFRGFNNWRSGADSNRVSSSDCHGYVQRSITPHFHDSWRNENLKACHFGRDFEDSRRKFRDDVAAVIAGRDSAR